MPDNAIDVPPETDPLRRRVTSPPPGRRGLAHMTHEHVLLLVLRDDGLLRELRLILMPFALKRGW